MGLLTCAVGLGPMVYAASAATPTSPSFIVECGPERTGPALRLTHDIRRDGDQAIITVGVVNTGGADAEGATFAEDLTTVPGQRIAGETWAGSGRLSFEKPLLRWTGDLAPGESAAFRFAVAMPEERMSIPVVGARASRTCPDAVVRTETTGGPAADPEATADTTPGATAKPGATATPDASATAGSTVQPDATTPGPTVKPGPTAASGTTAKPGAAASAPEGAAPETGPEGKGERPQERSPAEPGASSGAVAKQPEARAVRPVAQRAPIPFSQRYADDYHGAVTRAGNAVVTCYPPEVSDCLTRRNGRGNNNVAATYIDVDGDSSTFDSSTADLIVPPRAQIAYARLFWGGRGQTTTDTRGLPAGNRFAPAIDLRDQVLIKAPRGTGYETITAARGDSGSTPDGVTANGIVYGASADVTSLVAAAGPGTYTVANVQAARGVDGLGAFGGWSLVVAYRDATLPLRNIAIFDGFLYQQPNTAPTTITLSGFQTPITGAVKANLGEITYDGDNNITGDSLTVKTVNGPRTTLSDALHPADNFFNSTIATLGSQVTTRNPTYTNTLGYDSNIIDASPAFRNDDTSAQFTFSTSGDAYWPHALYTQIDLHQAGIRLTKTARVVGGGDPVPGAVVEYTMTATNTGDDNAIDVVLTDLVPAGMAYVPESIDVVSGPNAGPKTDAVGDDQGQFVGNEVTVFLGTGATPFAGGTLAVGQSTSVTFRATVTAQAAGSTVTNTATTTYASADTPEEPGTTQAETSIVVPQQVSSLALLKTASPTTVTAAGQVITYSHQVTNTGQTTLTGVNVRTTNFSGTEPPPVVTCMVTTLTPGQQTTCTGTYTVTQADIDAGSIVNTAVASGTPPSGPAIDSNPFTATVTTTGAPSLSLLKTASPATATAAGATITYSYEVHNSGNVTLTNISARDTAFSGTGTRPRITCPVTTLAPQATTTCAGTYTVTQADIDAGPIVNTATASGTPPTGPAVTSEPSTATVTTQSIPGLALLKSAKPATVTAAGQTVTYSYRVTNVGNVTITGLSVADVIVRGTGAPPVVTCPVTGLAPGEQTTCTGTYTVTQADMNAGSIVNVARATGTPPTGPAITSPPSTTTVGADQIAAVALVKSASPVTVTAAGQTVTYSYEVTNTGNVALTGIRATDLSFSGTGTPPVITCPATTLDPDQRTTCTGTYTVTQADIDAGEITNTAIASGTPPTGPAVNSNASTARVTAPAGSSLNLVKSASPATVTAAGQTVTYSYQVTNTGNVTLANLTVSDQTFSGTGTPPAIACPVATLPPGQRTTCTATYTTTQADIDAGSIVNTATASGTQPSGALTGSNVSTAAVTSTVTAGMTLAKSANPSVVTTAGQTVTYSYQVTNTGNVTLTGITAADTVFTGTGPRPVVTCPAAPLQPGRAVTCTGTYTVTQADVDSRAILNTAVASGTPPTGPAIHSEPSTARVVAPATPGLSLGKTAAPTSIGAAGQRVTYSYKIVNTGNTTVTGVGATDIAFSGTGTPPLVTCPLTTLRPAQTTTCTGTYTVTQTDVDAGTIVDTAIAVGVAPSGLAVTSQPSTATVTAPEDPGVSLLKTADPSSVSAAGQTITYSYLVTNTGNSTLINVGAKDAAFSGSGTRPVISCPVTTLVPGQQTTCTGTYTTTQVDINAGSIKNTATASGTSPSDRPVTSDPSAATVGTTPAPGVSLLKTAGPATVTSAGQTVAYTYLVANTGNVTLTNVRARDTSFSGTGTRPVITCRATELDPGRSTTCTATYTVTQADVDAGSIVNTAVASGTPPEGPAVTSQPSTATVTAPEDPGVSLLKTADPATVTAAGQTVAYTYQVGNLGNTTLTAVSVTDRVFSGTGPKPEIRCEGTTLTPGRPMTCTGTYTTTQADVDAGRIVNTATASGRLQSGELVTSDDSTATVQATASPSLSLVKSAEPRMVSAAGETVAYSYLATNTGNVTITNVSVQDTSFSGSGSKPMIRCDGTALTPGQQMRCTGTYTTTQADIDAGRIVNTATVSGDPPEGPAVTSLPSAASVTAPRAPGLTLVKTADPTTVTAAGDTVTYHYTITNTGNVTVSGLTVMDTDIAGTGTQRSIGCEVDSLAPGGSATCTWTYTVTQADMDACTITNRARASGLDPSGAAVISDTSTATVTVTVSPSLTLVTTADPGIVHKAGTRLDYSYLVTNTGNVTLTDIAVESVAFSGSRARPPVDCPDVSLEPGRSMRCTAGYVVKRGDLKAKSIVDTTVATAEAYCCADARSGEATVTVRVAGKKSRHQHHHGPRHHEDR
ncbi:hypothetical protein Sme01_09740 [Sphaerisporangium melleum]|uniref:DUF11 domain-containing protein n=1 Tax=Sphaerisporangium melleum TaxID=321316 RepID=A0A917VES5_9ACTN|nr:DUF11 domain-containing protein [Sphaerisporangium melleum]GGK67254.1 hypothetical protein GCM10007964_07870 [Sphaerisporangium melleum]GII68498.1 hypothetical protein Sme01_09740 [Sphaerisporangium melleum]